MRGTITGIFCLMLASTVFLGAGCGGGPKLSRVKGTVTMDGKPLPNVVVEFQPENGSPSKGITDASGHYKLRYTHKKNGAVLGKHTVRITTVASNSDEDSGDESGSETIPEKYNAKTELTAEVTSGSKTIDFDLKS